MERYSAEEQTQARRPIASLVGKSEKALQKLTPGTWQHTMLADNLKALHLGAVLLNRTSGGTDSFSQTELEAVLHAFASMIAIRNEDFLRRSSEEATPADLQTAQDLLDTLAVNAEHCVGLVANLIDSKRFELTTADAATSVEPERSCE